MENSVAGKNVTENKDDFNKRDVMRLFLVWDKKQDKWVLKSPKNTLKQNCLDIRTGELIDGTRIHCDFDQRSDAIKTIHRFKFIYMVFVKDLKNRGFLFCIRNDINRNAQLFINANQSSEEKEILEKEFIDWSDIDVHTNTGEWTFAKGAKNNKITAHLEEIKKNVAELLKNKRQAKNENKEVEMVEEKGTIVDDAKPEVIEEPRHIKITKVAKLIEENPIEENPIEEIIEQNDSLNYEEKPKEVEVVKDMDFDTDATPSSDVSIRIDGLTKVFKNGSGVKGASFEVPKSSFVLLVGPNGAGKTTIIRCLLRLYQEYAGDIRIDGIENSDVSAFGKISYVNEKPLFPSMSLKNYLMWISRFVGNNDSSSKAVIEKTCTQLGINHLLNSKPSRFSSGEQQKVLLAKTIIESKPIVIMDEPTSNMDVNTRKSLFVRLKEMNNEGKTILLCTHNVDEVEQYATHIVVIEKGIVKFAGKKPESSTSDFIERLLFSGEEKTQHVIPSTI